MDILKYNNKVQDLINKQREYLQTLDPNVLNVLKALLKEAKRLNDDELIGYTYHSLAFANYFVVNNYNLFLKYLSLAAKHLFNVDNSKELMHVYYLIAIDALNKDLYDLAYHYFLLARVVAEDNNLKTSAAILDENIAHTLFTIGEYLEGRKFIKKCLKGIKKDPKHPHYINNLASCYMNDLGACLNLNLIDEANIAYLNAKEVIDKNKDIFKLDQLINFYLLSTRLSIKNNDKKAINDSLNEMLKLANEMNKSSSYVDDTRLLVHDVKMIVNDLINIKEYKLAEKIIDSLSVDSIVSNSTDSLRNIIETKIDYYEATNNKKKILQCYHEQDKLYIREKSKEIDNNEYIRNLINLINELQIAQVNSNLKNKEFKQSAETDALTGLSNRYVFNKQMDDIFENSYQNKSLFGIGLLDLDNLKDINDKLGHQKGDELLIEIASALSKLNDDERIKVARYGGDEFVIIFDNMEDKEINKALNKIYDYTDIKFSIGVSNGIPKDKIKPWDFLQAADNELYIVKTKKKNNEKQNDISVSKFKYQKMNKALSSDIKYTRKLEKALYNYDLNNKLDDPTNIYNSLKDLIEHDNELFIPITINNKQLNKLSKEKEISITSLDNLNISFNTIQKDNKYYIPLYTNNKDNAIKISSKNILNELDNKKDCLGYIINPNENDFILDKDMISYLKDYNKTSITYLYDGSVLDLHVDTIVNAANKSLMGGFGVDGAIHKAAGFELANECLKLNGCETGQAKMTKAYNIIDVDYIIHTVGPIYSNKKSDEIDLFNCYYNSLNLAKDNNLNTIAFPCISTGAYCYPLEDASIIAINAVNKWIKDNPDYPMIIYYCCYKEEEYEVYKKLLAK